MLYFSIFNLITISCIYLVLTPNSRSVFRVGVSLNIHSFIVYQSSHRQDSIYYSPVTHALSWTRNISMAPPWGIDQTTHCTKSGHSTTELHLAPLCTGDGKLLWIWVCSLMVRWVVGSILHGGPIELFPVPVSAPWLVTKAVVCAILSVGWCT